MSIPKPVYAACGLLIINQYDEPVARLTDTLIAQQAADLMVRAAREQNRRHYTASARLYFKAESLPGFSWLNR